MSKRPFQNKAPLVDARIAFLDHQFAAAKGILQAYPESNAVVRIRVRIELETNGGSLGLERVGTFL